MKPIELDVSVLNHLNDTQNALQLAWEVFSAASNGQALFSGACASMCEHLNLQMDHLEDAIQKIEQFKQEVKHGNA